MCCTNKENKNLKNENFNKLCDDFGLFEVIILMCLNKWFPNERQFDVFSKSAIFIKIKFIS